MHTPKRPIHAALDAVQPSVLLYERFVDHVDAQNSLDLRVPHAARVGRGKDVANYRRGGSILKRAGQRERYRGSSGQTR